MLLTGVSRTSFDGAGVRALFQDVIGDGVVQAPPGDVHGVRLEPRVVDLGQFGGEGLSQGRHVVTGHVEL